ncbi:ATP-binding protein [Mesorhizobium escarrei]|uniref:ATP-binding protein n=1 Tax=Mesorhizobium escarrei TaxID=666018 RepID=UPI00265AD9C8|nr:ATP-binding protein [Mesorhizobium escarrei]
MCTCRPVRGLRSPIPVDASHAFDKFTRAQLLVLDGFGTHSLTEQQRSHLFEIVEERYRRTAHVPVARWHYLIAHPSSPTPFLERIVHNAHRTPHGAPGRQNAESKKAGAPKPASAWGHC